MEMGGTLEEVKNAPSKNQGGAPEILGKSAPCTISGVVAGEVRLEQEEN